MPRGPSAEAAEAEEGGGEVGHEHRGNDIKMNDSWLYGNIQIFIICKERLYLTMINRLLIRCKAPSRVYCSKSSITSFQARISPYSCTSYS